MSIFQFYVYIRQLEKVYQQKHVHLEELKKSLKKVFKG